LVGRSIVASPSQRKTNHRWKRRSQFTGTI